MYLYLIYLTIWCSYSLHHNIVCMKSFSLVGWFFQFVLLTFILLLEFWLELKDSLFYYNHLNIFFWCCSWCSSLTVGWNCFSNSLVNVHVFIECAWSNRKLETVFSYDFWLMLIWYILGFHIWYRRFGLFVSFYLAVEVIGEKNGDKWFIKQFVIKWFVFFGIGLPCLFGWIKRLYFLRQVVISVWLPKLYYW